MALTFEAFRNYTIPSSTTDTFELEAQFLKQPFKCRRNNTLTLLNLSQRSWSRMCPRTRTFKYVESSLSLDTENTNPSCGIRPVTRPAHGLPCLTTCRHTFFNRDGTQKHRRSGIIVRCEVEREGQRDQPCSEQTPGHEDQHCRERKCNKRHSHAHSDRSPGSESQGELREWKGMRDTEHEHSEGSEWTGNEILNPEYTPKHGASEDECRIPSSLRYANKGYVIKVSKELMGLFCYIEKRKRSMIKELARTLRQVAIVALVLTCVRGIFAPLVEVFKTTPPTWSKLLLMLVSLDSVAICYLTIESAEPLEQLAALATENRPDIMEGVEKEEEMMLKIAVEFIRLFKKLRNIAISITVSQTAQLMFTVLGLKDPNFVGNCTKVVQTWMQSPWT